jgi:hypothetical protein
MCKKVLILLLVGLSANVSLADLNPVHSWTFDDGTANDSVGEAHGTLIGGAAIVDGAMVTTAQNQWMEMPADVIDINSYDAVTIEAWYTPTPGGNTGWSMLAYFGGSSEPDIAEGGVGINGYFITSARADDMSRAGISTGELTSPWGDETMANGPEYDDGLLHHMVSTLDANEITLYIDGELVASTPMDTHNNIHDLDNDYALLAKGGYAVDPEWIGAIHEFNIYGSALLPEEIQALYSVGVGGSLDFAFGPSPSNGAIEVQRDVDLTWRSGTYAVTHDVYFGTDVNDVNEASKDDTRGVLVGPDYTDMIYDPPGLLDYDVTYYWRVDEINEEELNSPWKGNTWSFTVRNFVEIEDFEDYSDYPPNEVFNTWLDGWNDPTNGSTSGYPAPDFVGGEHYLENEIVHSGEFSLPLLYDNSAARLSYATKTLTSGRDWTVDDVITLTIFFQGNAGNGVVPMYVALDGDAVVTHPESRVVLIGEWTRWDIALQEFADQGVDLTDVSSITLGFGNPANPTTGGEGHVLFDDIRLYRSEALPYEPARESVDPGNANLMAYYDFENDVRDNSGNNHHGTEMNNPIYIVGPTGFGSAIQFNGTTQYVSLPIDSLIASSDDITIACWANFYHEDGSMQRLWDFGVAAQDDSDPNIYMFVTPRSGTNGPLQFGITTGGNDTQSNIYSSATLPLGWHHVAASIDSSTMTVRLYQDGMLVAEGETSFLPSDLGATDQNYIGKSQWLADAYYDGAIDEFRIYDRVLSEAEILFLMGW